MIRRFVPIIDAGERREHLSAASTWITRTLRLRANVSITCSASFCRSRPHRRIRRRAARRWPVDQCCVFRGVHSARQAKDHPSMPTCADLPNGLAGIVRHVQPAAAVDLVREARDRRSLFRGRHLDGTERRKAPRLAAIAAIAAVDDPEFEARRQRRDLVAGSSRYRAARPLRVLAILMS
jgi:hypothetical protein